LAGVSRAWPVGFRVSTEIIRDYTVVRPVQASFRFPSFKKRTITLDGNDLSSQNWGAVYFPGWPPVLNSARASGTAR